MKKLFRLFLLVFVFGLFFFFNNKSEAASSTISSGYISSGIVVYNSPNYYYKGIIDIRSNISYDTSSPGGGYDTTSCAYTLGNGRTNAGGVNLGITYTTLNTGYCYKLALNPMANITVGFRIHENFVFPVQRDVGLTTSYIYDATAPSVPINSTPVNQLQTSATSLWFSWTPVTDNVGGIGLSGYNYQISTDPTFSTTIYTGYVTIPGVTIGGLTNGTYYRRVNAVDKIHNISSWSTSTNFVVNTISPTGTFVINTGATYTSGVTVTLVNTSIVGAINMRFGQNGGTRSPWSLFSSYLGFSLTPGDGIKTVNGEFANNVNTTISLSDSIILDTLPPYLNYDFNRTWANTVKGIDSSYSYGNAIAKDSNGNLYVGGTFQGTVNFGSSISLTSTNGTNDAYLAKVSSTGQRLRAIKGGGIGDDKINGITLDGQGNIYVGGSFTETASFGSTIITSSGASDIFISKISPTGQWVNTWKAGGNGMDEIKDLSMYMDFSGSIYAVGSFSLTSSRGNITRISSGSTDIFVAKISPLGQWLDVRKAGGVDSDYGISIDVDMLGNVFVAGSFQGTATFGSIALTSLGSFDGYIAKLYPSLGQWSRAIKGGGGSRDEYQSIAYDMSGNIYAAGFFSETASFGSTSLNSNPGRDAMISKVNSGGQWVWTKQVGGNISDQAYGIKIGPDQKPVIVGNYSGNPSYFGGLSLDGAGTFVLKMTTIGGFEKVLKATSIDSISQGNDLTIDTSGNIYVAGNFVGMTGYRDNISLPGSSYAQAYVAKIWGPNNGIKPFVINNNDATTNSANVTLNIIPPTENRTPVELRFSNDLSVWSNRIPFTTNYPWLLSPGYGVKTVYMQARDGGGNTSTSFLDDIVLLGSSCIPTVSTGYISLGITGYRSPDYYYKGNPDIKVEVQNCDNIDLDTGSCKYTIDGTNRYNANYAGTTSAGYCYKTGIIGSTDISIRFSIQNILNSTGYGATGVYIYDNVPPNSILGVDFVRAKAIHHNTYAVATDNGGNSYIVGSFTPTAIFGSTTLTGNLGYSTDGFVAKLSPSGQYLGAKQGGNLIRSISIDSGGNSYILGVFSGTTTFGSITLTSNSGPAQFVAKLSPSLQYLRAIKLSNNILSLLDTIAVDSGGNSYIAGNFQGTTTFGSTILTSVGLIDGFVAKLSPSGQFLRVNGSAVINPVSGLAGGSIQGIAVDSGGNSYIAGSYYLTGIFGSTTLISNGDSDIFVAKLSPSGQYLWAIGGGGNNPNGDMARGIAVDNGGNTYIAGIFGGTAIFGSTTLTVAGGVNANRDVFVSKLSPSGQYIRTIKGGAALDDEARGISIDDLGNSYVVGYYRGNYIRGNAIFGPFTLPRPSYNTRDTFITKISPSGQYLRIKIGSSFDHYETIGNKVAVDTAGNIFSVGLFGSITHFGQLILSSPLLFGDSFITKISPDKLFTINNDDYNTTSGNVILTINCPIDDGIKGEEIAYGNTPNPNNWTSCTSTKPWVLTPGDGMKTVYMKIRDALGNETGDYIDSIYFTTTLPNPPICTPSQSFSNDMFIDCNMLLGDIRYTLDGSTPNCFSSWIWGMLPGIQWMNINTTTILKAITCDAFNNASPVSTYTYTLVPPTPSANMHWAGNTPEDGSDVYDESVNIDLGIQDENLNIFNRQWNDATYKIYDKSLVFMTNANTIESLGENENTLIDVSSYVNNGDIQGAESVKEGRNGSNALYFRGGKNRVEIGDNESLHMKDGFTLSAWINPTEFISNGVIIAKSNTNPEYPFTYGLSYSDSEENPYQVSIGLEDRKISCTTRNQHLQPGVFTHIVGVFDRNTLRIYIDGLLDNTCEFEETNLDPTDGNLYIGYYPYGDLENNFIGTLDDIMIYNRALDNDNVSLLYNMSFDKYDRSTRNFRVAYIGLNFSQSYTYGGFAESLYGYTYTESRMFNYMGGEQ